jgi:nucleoside-diphosphate kinase
MAAPVARTMRASRSCSSTTVEPANGARFLALADGGWRESEAERVFLLFPPDASTKPARPGACWASARASSANTGVRTATGGARVRKFGARSCGAAPFRLGARPTIPALTFKERIMAVTRTFSIIKPDATRRNLTGAVTKMLEEAGLRVVASKRIQMTKEQAEGFYGVHRERPFFNDLVSFMISGPVVVQVLEGEDAVKRNRDIMGATNPANADAGTIRKELAESIEANSVHGSDSEENAAIEIAFFFKPEEIVG